MKSIPIRSVKLCDLLNRVQDISECLSCEYYDGRSENYILCKFEDREMN
jgi:hypothetical protein